LLSAFAKIIGGTLTTTLRHYLRLGLINTMCIYGKLHFLPLSAVQLALVNGWVSCGESLAGVLEGSGTRGLAEAATGDAGIPRGELDWASENPTIRADRVVTVPSA
jgi:hypothetical protein